jgi:glycerophosphoryl diester phosphodiesterase
MKYNLIICFFICFSSINIEAQTVIKKLPEAKNKLIVIAHRGDHTIAPENSLLAIHNAIQDGVDYVELDIRTTKDKKLVLMHDGSVDRMTNGHGKVNEMYFDSIRSLKLYNKQISFSDTLQVPSFEEALKVCKKKINIYLDFKDADVEQVYQEVLKMKMQDQLVVYINSPKQLVDWRKYAPQIPLILSLNTKIIDSASMIQYLAKTPIDILDGDWTEYTVQTVKAANTFGVPVWADMQSKQEDEAYWLKGIELGLSGIQTDHPKELVQFIRRLSKNKKPLTKR